MGNMTENKTDEDEYEPEVWTSGEWWLESSNDDYWDIVGMIKTPSTGSTRPEIVGVVRTLYAQGIVDAHNAAIRERTGNNQIKGEVYGRSKEKAGPRRDAGDKRGSKALAE